MDVVSAILSSSSESVNVNLRANSGWSALILAAAGGHTATVEVLLGLGAPSNTQDHHLDVNARDNDGNTALMQAAYKGFSGVVQMLLKVEVSAQIYPCILVEVCSLEGSVLPAYM